MAEFFAANQTLIIVVAVVAALYAAVNYGPALLAKLKSVASGGTVDPASDITALINKIKSDVKLSAPARATICSVLVAIDTAVEYLPNDADKAAGRNNVKALGSLFQVTPTPAADATVTTKA